MITAAELKKKLYALFDKDLFNNYQVKQTNKLLKVLVEDLTTSAPKTIGLTPTGQQRVSKARCCPAVIKEFCEQTVNGLSIQEIADSFLTTPNELLEWVESSKEYREQYDIAIKKRTYVLADLSLRLPELIGTINPSTGAEWTHQAVKLKQEAIRKDGESYNKEIFGKDQTTLNIGDGGSAISFIINKPNEEQFTKEYLAKKRIKHKRLKGDVVDDSDIIDITPKGGEGGTN